MQELDEPAIHCNVSVKSKLQHPPGHTPGIWHLCHPGEEGIWSSKSSRGWGIWSPCFRGGEFELHPRFHVKSLAWRAIMGDAVLEDFRGKDCAFVANWLRGKGLNKLCAVFEGIWILIFLILDTGFEYMNVLSSVYNEIEYLYWHFQYNNKKLNRDKLLWPATCMLINKVSDDECQWNEHDVVISISGIFFL